MKVLVQKRNCAAITAKQHQESLIRDALIAGIQSDGIRIRLLELNDDKASLDDCLALASAIEVSTQLSKDFNPYNHDDSVYAAAISKEPETPKDDYR